ncbi:MAG: hypothetical protein R2764_12690 [Bacteroidales bacterium]
MAKKKKSVSLFKKDLTPSSSRSAKAERKGRKHTYTEFDEKGNLVLEIKYNEEAEVDEKLEITYDDNGFIKEEKSFFEGNELSDHASYERDENGVIRKSFKHYQDGTTDTINYRYDTDGNLIEKVTVDSYDEVESKELATYENGKLILKEIYEYDELMAKETYLFDDYGNMIEHHTWSPDDGNRSYKHVYDEKGNLIQSNQYNNKEELSGKAVYSYNKIGKVVEAIEETPYGTSKTSITYDENGNAVEQLETNSSGEVNNKVERKYNADNDVTEAVVFINFHGRSVDQNYVLNYEYTYF